MRTTETLGIEDFKSFIDYPEMREKHEYLAVNNQSTGRYVENTLLDIAIGSAFGEGIQLFGSFIMLLSLADRDLFSGMRDVVAYSLRDETVHVRGMTQIFRTLVSEYLGGEISDDLKRGIYLACREMVELGIEVDQFGRSQGPTTQQLTQRDHTQVHQM